MATLAKVTFTYLDAENKTTTRSYKARDNNPTDAEVQALATDAQALTALSLIKAVVTRSVDITAITDAAEATSSRQRDASLRYNKSDLRSSEVGEFTFNLPQYKAALLDDNGRIDTTNPVFDGWTENFDDGAGVAGIQGDWFAGNQQELIEDSDPLEGFQNKD